MPSYTLTKLAETLREAIDVLEHSGPIALAFDRPGQWPDDAGDLPAVPNLNLPAFLKPFVADPGTSQLALENAFGLLQRFAFNHLWAPRPTGGDYAHYLSLFPYVDCMTTLQGFFGGKHLPEEGEFHPYLNNYREHVTHVPLVGALGYLLMGAPGHEAMIACRRLEELHLDVFSFDEVVQHYEDTLRHPDRDTRRLLHWLENHVRPLVLSELFENGRERLKYIILASWWVASLCHDIGNLFEGCLRFHMTGSGMLPLLPWRATSHRGCPWQPLRSFVGRGLGRALHWDGHMPSIAVSCASELGPKRHVFTGVHYILNKALETPGDDAASGPWLLALALAVRAILNHEGAKPHSDATRRDNPSKDVQKDPLSALLFISDRILLVGKASVKDESSSGDRKISFSVDEACHEMELTWDRPSRTLSVTYPGMVDLDREKKSFQKVKEVMDAGDAEGIWGRRISFPAFPDLVVS